MLKNRMNIPCLFSSDVVVSSNLVPVKITALHSDQNRNNTNIGLDAIKKATNTLYNKPILAYIRQTEDGEYDFAGHEIELDWDENGDIKRKFYEYPVGLIPESSEIDYFEKDGKTYLTCTGYIYKEYSNETLDIMKKTDGKCVSIEIDIQNGEAMDDGIYDIKEFSFLGVTILSDEVTPGMDENCRIDFIRNVDDYSEFLNKAIGDVKKFEEEHKEAIEDKQVEDNEQDNPEVNEKVEDEQQEEPKEEPKEEPTEPAVEPVEPKEEPKTEPTENVEPEEPVVEPIEQEVQTDYSIFNELFDEEITSIKQLKELFVSKISALESKVETLSQENKTYKLVERENQVNELLESINFDFEEDEISELLENAKNFTISISDLKKELFAIVGQKNIEKNKKNEKKNFSNDGILLQNKHSVKKTKSIYAELFEDIL